jgi:nicotinamidase-related amidase
MGVTIVTSGKDDEEFFRQRGFGIKIGFGERPALMIIDMVKGFTDPSMPLGAKLDDELEAQKPLVAVAHERNIPVIFTTVTYDEPDIQDAGIWALKQKGARTLTAGSEAVKVDPRLDKRPADLLLVKKYASCFFGTDLVPRLNARRIDTLILTGCTTSGCVRATAVDAVQNGFRPMVVREAVGDRSVAAHEQSLFDLNAKYADVVSLDETLQYLKTVGHNRPGA